MCAPASRITTCLLLGALIGVTGNAAGQPVAPHPEKTSGRTTANRPHVAVAGFTASQDVSARDEWLPVGVEETLCWRLRRVPGVLVVPTMRVHKAQRELQEIGATAVTTQQAVAALGAERLVTGRCAGHVDRLELELSILAVGTPARQLDHVTLPPGRLFEVLDAATRWLLERLSVAELSPELSARILAAPARSPSAVEYYGRAVNAQRDGDLAEARRFALRSLSYDQLYRPALGTLVQIEVQAGPAAMSSSSQHLRMLSELARRADDPIDLATAELGRGALAHLTGDFSAAYQRYESSLAISYAAGAVYGEIAALTNLGDLHLTRPIPPGLDQSQVELFARQDFQWSIEWQRIVVDMVAELGDLVSETTAANKLALTYERMGDREAAIAMQQRALAAADRLGSAGHRAAAWLHLARLHEGAQRLDEALAAVEQSLALADTRIRPAAKFARAGILRGLGRTAEALAEYEEVYAHIRPTDDLASQLACARNIAALRRELGRRADARAALLEAIDIAQALGSPAEAELRAELAALQGD
jgi:tetratricopeptide (TPR) repeat protein